MTLDEVVRVVPQLGILCSNVLMGAAPGSGIKTMRLVNKQLRLSMLHVVQGYTLRLNGAPLHLMSFFKQMSVLQGAKLSRLRIVVKELAGEVVDMNPIWARVMTTQLHCLRRLGGSVGSSCDGVVLRRTLANSLT